MKNLDIFKNRFYKAVCVLCVVFCAVVFLKAQSTRQEFPTPITSNEISGTIKARDIGDSRLTNYFYVFNASQGDVFINIVTNNLNGDIDIFNAENLNPLTKVVVYADSSQNETGRVVYLRKPEKLILRIQGRTPNDGAATYTIKFAGSFQPVSNIAENEQPPLPEVKTENQSDVIVNSVGTIIGAKPKPTPTPSETVAKIEETKNQIEEKDETADTTQKNPETTDDETVKSENQPEKRVEVVVTENSQAQENTEVAAKTETKTEETEAEPVTKPTPARKSRAKSRRSAARKTENPPESATPNPLESVRLIVLLKDGSKIERPMSEILRVNVDNKGMLTIVAKDGSIKRYSILDVAKMSIE